MVSGLVMVKHQEAFSLVFAPPLSILKKVLALVSSCPDLPVTVGKAVTLGAEIFPAEFSEHRAQTLLTPATATLTGTPLTTWLRLDVMKTL